MGFSAAWLELREPADHAARDNALLADAAIAAGENPVIVDLGCGTRSTIRAFEGRLARPAEWRLIDNDPELLAHAATAATGRDDSATTHRIDLRELDALPLHGAGLVTASALLDLCSHDWVKALADRLSRYKLPFYAALNYDGQMDWTPADPADAIVTRAFNTHQRGDKGFGPALGPDAADAIAKIFTAAGYSVLQAESPWRLGSSEAALQRELVTGIADAAHQAGAAEALGWGALRSGNVDSAACRIGHRDLLALPAGAA